MTLVFDDVEYLNSDREPLFNAVFLTQSSYIDLLDLVKEHFNIPIRDPSCDMPCMSQSYMLISNKREKIKYGIGKNVSLKIKSLFYNPKVKILLAIVKLKNNFTDFPVPYIIISKPEAIKQESIDKIVLKHHNISLDILVNNRFIDLEDIKTATVHGKVGVFFQEGLQEQSSHARYLERSKDPVKQLADNIVTRPEVTISVDSSHPPIKRGQDESTSLEPKKEFYMGLEVYKGRRGGKYVIKDGKKKYVTDMEIANCSKKSDTVVYNVNLLAP